MTKLLVPGGASSHGSHRLAEPGHCPRKYTFHYLQGLTPKRSPSYYLEGTLIHIALAYWFAQRLAVKPKWFVETSLFDALAQEGAGNPEAIELAKSVLASYAQYYGDDTDWEIVAIEEEFSATVDDLRRVLNPYYASNNAKTKKAVSCRIDLLIRAGGRLWAVDYKSVGRGGRDGLYAFNPQGEYAVHWQFLVQTGILKHTFGPQFGGIIVERVLKTTPHDFDRSVVPIPRAAFQTLPDVVERQLLLEERLGLDYVKACELGVEADYFAEPHWWACHPYGKPCEYRPICLADNDMQRRDIIDTEYKLDTKD